MVEKKMPNVNFKGFMAYSAQTNWNAVKMFYGNGDPSLTIVGCECTWFFHWFAYLNKMMHKYINSSCAISRQ